MQQRAALKPIDGSPRLKTPMKPRVFALSGKGVRNRTMIRNRFATHHVSPNDTAAENDTILQGLGSARFGQRGGVPRGVPYWELSLKFGSLAMERDSIYTGGGAGTIRIKIPITSYKTY